MVDVKQKKTPAAPAVKIKITAKNHTHRGVAVPPGSVIEVTPAKARAMCEGDNPVAEMQ